MEEVRDGKIRVTPDPLVTPGGDGSGAGTLLTAYLAKLLTEPNGGKPAQPYKRAEHPDYTSDLTKNTTRKKGTDCRTILRPNHRKSEIGRAEHGSSPGAFPRL